MTFLLFLFGIFLALGMFLLTADLLRLPRLATQRAMLSVGRQEKKQARSVEALLMGWAIKLAPHIHMDEYKRGRLKNTLAAAGLNMTPEEYTAFAMVKTGAVLLTVIPCLLIFPMLALIVVLLAVAVYFKEIRRAEEKLSAKRDEIEAELPRFVATITQELAASRDVLSMIEHYKQNSGPVFSAELDVLTADMRSGSYEAALTRFEARFNSPLLSDIVRGLIGVLRGDNGVHYFQMLSHDMKQLELQRLKAKAMKIPPKIRVFSFVLLMCFLVTYLSIIIYEIIHSLGGMFSERRCPMDYTGSIYRLIDRAEDEMKEYAQRVKQLSADEIYRHSAETAAKESLLSALIHDSYELDDDDLDLILKPKNPVEALYQFLTSDKTDLSSESSISSILSEYNAQCQERDLTLGEEVTMC